MDLGPKEFCDQHESQPWRRWNCVHARIVMEKQMAPMEPMYRRHDAHLPLRWSSIFFKWRVMKGLYFHLCNAQFCWNGCRFWDDWKLLLRNRCRSCVCSRIFFVLSCGGGMWQLSLSLYPLRAAYVLVFMSVLGVLHASGGVRFGYIHFFFTVLSYTFS